MWTQHDKATANLTVDGLAICCFASKSEPKRWQIAFLRQPDHALRITIDPGDGGKPDHIEVDKDASRLEIRTVKGRTPDYGEHPHGFYDKGKLKENRKKKPSGQDAKENFRWALDLQDKDDVKHGKIKLKRPEGYGVTLAYIDDALFYTCNQTSSNLYMVPWGVDPNLWPEKLKEWELGMTNDQLGADIECEDDGGIIILVNGVEKKRLHSRPGKPWQICLMNMRPHHMDERGKAGGHGETAARDGGKLEKGDFHLYYDAIETSDGLFAVWGYPMRWAAPRAESRDCGMAYDKSGRTDCDSVWLGGDNTSLEFLLPGGSGREG